MVEVKRTILCDRCRLPKSKWKYMLREEPSWIGAQPEYNTTTVRVNYGGVYGRMLDLCPTCAEKVLLYALGMPEKSIEKPRKFLREMTKEEIARVDEAIALERKLCVDLKNHDQMFDYIQRVIKRVEEEHQKEKAAPDVAASGAAKIGADLPISIASYHNINKEESQ